MNCQIVTSIIQKLEINLQEEKYINPINILKKECPLTSINTVIKNAGSQVAEFKHHHRLGISSCGPQGNDMPNKIMLDEVQNILAEHKASLEDVKCEPVTLCDGQKMREERIQDEKAEEEEETAAT